MQAAIPDVWSLPLNVIGTAWLYQPFTSAARPGVPPVTAGAVWSTLISCSTVTVALSSLALQNSVVPGVSVVSVLSWQPAITTAVDGLTVQSTETSDWCQPEQSAGAGVHSTVMLGAASACAGPNDSIETMVATMATMPRRRTAVTSAGLGTGVPGPSPYCIWGRIEQARGLSADLQTTLTARLPAVNPPLWGNPRSLPEQPEGPGSDLLAVVALSAGAEARPYAPSVPPRHQPTNLAAVIPTPLQLVARA